jgi:hypothetical protein
MSGGLTRRPGYRTPGPLLLPVLPMLVVMPLFAHPP